MATKGKGCFLGIDVGSISANTVIVNFKKEILEEHYHRLQGQPILIVRNILQDIFRRIPPADFANISFVGSGGEILAQLLNAHFFNEIIAQCKAIEWLHPNVKTVIEMGGEDSKLIALDYDTSRGSVKLLSFSMNTICAAGTGSFLDQQATRLGLSIEDFGSLALRSASSPRLAGRCSVFAKTDMIHLQQIAVPDYDIVAGLCFAVARNFKSIIGKGLAFRPPVAFQGGVAANLGVKRAFAEVLGLSPEEFIIPKYFASMGAIGACLLSMENPTCRTHWEGLEKLENYFAYSLQSEKGEQPLSLSTRKTSHSTQTSITPNQKKIKGYLGVDVGSISTNLVVLDEHKRILSKRYLMTAGRPIEAIKQGLREIGEELTDHVHIMGLGTTGSGRYLTGDFIGADIVRNEITAQATAAAHIDPEVDTIFEIGGQDSKYISLKNGAVVDFEMNKVCAAGTGSFLEEQAEKLGISIKDEFAQLALRAQSPVSLGERCTVFMESDLVHHQQRGAKKEDLVAGLCYSIVHNYLNKVVSKKPVGERIFFQGGTAFNQGVVAAFEKVLGKNITVPPDHEVTGAIGAAILAMKEKESGPSKFKGFDLNKKEYNLSSFECNGCVNRCEIHTLTVKGEVPLYYGGRCEKYEIETQKKDLRHIPDLFGERDALLYQFEKENDTLDPSAPVIGLPRALFFYDLLPFWAAYFNALRFRVKLSDPTNKKLIREGLEVIVTETCFPIKAAHGHVLNLINKNIQTIFFPSLINFTQPQPNIPQSFACPYVQSFPYTIQSAINFKEHGVDFIHLPLFMAKNPDQLGKELIPLMKRLKKNKKEHCEAIVKAFQAQQKFTEALRQRGKEILARLDPKEKACVIVSRAYNGCDPGINLRIPVKLREMGVKAIPLDMLPLDEVDISKKWGGMYWAYGQKILAAAQIIKKDHRLFPIYITNFSCGPDSFISHYFQKELDEKPFLQLEVDEHSADAGVITRLEAFLDSLKNVRPKHPDEISKTQITIIPSNGKKKVIFIPRMSDHAFALAGAFQACGNPSEVLPESDSETVKLGRKYTSGKECYPCILTTGNMVKATQRSDFKPDHSAFLMFSSNGPCRFGQYSHFQRLVLDELGFHQVPIFAFNQDDQVYQELKTIGNEFASQAWQGIVAIDLLDKKLRETRPYEKHAGETNHVYQHYLGQVFDYIKNKKIITGLLHQARKEFEDIPIDRGIQKPIIGIVGEIYVRSNPFSNENIVGQIESLGGEVWLPPVGEWISYTNFTALRRTWKNGSWSNLLKTYITNTYQQIYEHKLSKIFATSLKNFPEPSTRQTIRNARPYLDPTFEGEAILSIGKAIDFIRKGVHGIVNVMPFTCMPGTIVNTLLKQFRGIEKNIPVLTMSYDGQEQTNTRTRLEAFMHQVGQV